jgi:DNA helicase HerA-like ATPase
MLLARQARKYGLGLILATQNPMDLDYNATANFSTQIFGKANAPQVVKFIQNEMERRGLPGMNPGELKTGQFYCATPSLDRPVRLQAPMCLSYHPNNIQLRDEDILSRAARTA